MSNENPIQAQILMRLSRGLTRMFRNHVGQGWTGKFIRTDGPFVILKNARRCTFGLIVGSSDTVGWTSVVVTPEMVGKVVAIFTAIEVKDATKPTEDQTRFINNVRAAGGIAGVAHSPDEATAILAGYGQ